MATKAIPVVAAKVPSTQTNFPVYIKPSAMTGWGSLTSAEANSIRFYSDSGLTTELAREVVSNDEIHVKVPSLTTTTTIYADYDGVRADYAVTDTYGRNAVWSDFVNVWHLEGGADSATGSDSLTATDGAVTYNSQIIGQGAVMNNRRLNKDANMSLNWSNDYSWTWWAKPAAFAGYAMDHVTTTGANRRVLFIWDLGSSNSLVIYCGGFAAANTFTVGSLTADVYSKWTLNKSGTTWTLYRNGVSQGTKSSGTTTYSVNKYSVGGSVDSGANGNASFDEVRLSTSARSADWINTEYNNQNDVGTFWGTVTDAGGATASTGFLAWL